VVVDAAGGVPRKGDLASHGSRGALWIDDRTLLVPSDVYPDVRAGFGRRLRRRLQPQHLEEETKPGGQARVYDSLPARTGITGRTAAARTCMSWTSRAGRARLTPGATDVPPFTVGGPDDYDVAPDGKEIAFVRKDGPIEAVSTNGELYVVPVAGGPADQGLGQCRLRRRAALQPGREDDRVPGADARRLRGGSAGASWSTTGATRASAT
jgi:hypothetical protein